ncbi:MAG: hypothetical protein AAF533_26140 [Acidobacteriota bacterium]
MTLRFERLVVQAALAGELPHRPRGAGWDARANGRVGPQPMGPLSDRSALVIVGSCGRLGEGPLGELVLPEWVVDRTGQRREPDLGLFAAVSGAARRQGIATTHGGLTESHGVIDSAAERIDLARRTGAEFVDMESAAWAAAAEKAGAPWCVLRFVSDSADHPLGFLAELLGGWPESEPPLGALLAGLLRRPGHLRPLARLGGAASRARRRVGALLAELEGDALPADP